MGNIFKTMSLSLSTNEVSESDIKEIPSYIYGRWLSGSPYYIHVANLFNRYSDIPILNQFELVQNFSKYNLKNRIKYIPYPKGASEKEIKDIEYISKYYKCSTERAKEYLELISEKELNRLRTAYMKLES
jgi:hypothetical protein